MLSEGINALRRAVGHRALARLVRRRLPLPSLLNAPSRKLC